MPNSPKRRKATYLFAFLFSMAYLSLLIFAPSFRMGTKKSSDPTFELQRLHAQQLLLLGRHDGSGRYRILPFVLEGTRWPFFSMNASLCVATQIALGQVDLLLPFVEAAPGAVSVALFLPRDEIVSVLALLKFLRTCNRSLREKASFHFLVPQGKSFEQNLAHLVEKETRAYDCGRPAREVLKEITAGRQLTKAAGPPAGLLRNIALEHCHNEWRASLDAHMHFPEKPAKLGWNLGAFLATRNESEKAAFVLPEYVLIRGSMPKNRAELLSHFLDGKVRPKGDYREAYAASHLQRWQRHGTASSSKVNVAFKLHKFNFGYQPALIIKLGSPYFDERYAGDAMTKFSQECPHYIIRPASLHLSAHKHENGLLAFYTSNENPIIFDMVEAAETPAPDVVPKEKILGFLAPLTTSLSATVGATTNAISNAVAQSTGNVLGGQSGYNANSYAPVQGSSTQGGCCGGVNQQSNAYSQGGSYSGGGYTGSHAPGVVYSGGPSIPTSVVVQVPVYISGGAPGYSSVNAVAHSSSGGIEQAVSQPVPVYSEYSHASAQTDYVHPPAPVTGGGVIYSNAAAHASSGGGYANNVVYQKPETQGYSSSSTNAAASAGASSHGTSHSSGEWNEGAGYSGPPTAEGSGGNSAASASSTSAASTGGWGGGNAASSAASSAAASSAGGWGGGASAASSSAASASSGGGWGKEVVPASAASSASAGGGGAWGGGAASSSASASSSAGVPVGNFGATGSAAAAAAAASAVVGEPLPKLPAGWAWLPSDNA